MIKIIAYNILVLCTFLQASAQKISHFDHVQKEFNKTRNQDTFEQYKAVLIEYYINGIYERDVDQVCAQAQQYFASIPVQDNAIIIFDIDDTAVYHFQTRNEFKFIWQLRPELATKTNFDGPAIQPVLDLYHYLLERGFKIVFMTGRGTQIADITINQLHNAGYTAYEKLILCPWDIVTHDTLWEWKLNMRKALSQKYHIVGSVADREIDFQGGCTGFEVKLPNYLY